MLDIWVQIPGTLVWLSDMLPVQGADCLREAYGGWRGRGLARVTIFQIIQAYGRGHRGEEARPKNIHLSCYLERWYPSFLRQLDRQLGSEERVHDFLQGFAVALEYCRGHGLPEDVGEMMEDRCHLHGDAVVVERLIKEVLG